MNPGLDDGGWTNQPLGQRWSWILTLINSHFFGSILYSLSLAECFKQCLLKPLLHKPHEFSTANWWSMSPSQHSLKIWISQATSTGPKLLRPKDKIHYNLQRSRGFWGQRLRMHKILKPNWLLRAHHHTGFIFQSPLMGHCEYKHPWKGMSTYLPWLNIKKHRLIPHDNNGNQKAIKRIHRESNCSS